MPRAPGRPPLRAGQVRPAKLYEFELGKAPREKGPRTAFPFQVFNFIADTTGLQVLPSDDHRRYVLLQNVGSVNVYVGLDGPADANNGFILAPGASWEPIASVPSSAISVAASSGTASIRVISG